ncbi:type II toxin-antitoxin system HicB family antitoxin [Candidatus Uhrbacteria bacterium]|nr:type II toxin-antitoxin system HicB family antitoxin [Candidatus Uhrbacteria bacterium]
MDQYTFRVIIEPDGKFFHAYVPALSGCHTSGKSIAEARKNIQEAMELYLETLVDLGEAIPRDESFETFQTASVPLRNKRRVRAEVGQYA